MTTLRDTDFVVWNGEIIPGDDAREAAAEARLGARLITKGITSEALSGRSPAVVLKEVLASDLDEETVRLEIGRIWRQLIEPSMGLGRIARLEARGWDAGTVWLREEAMGWPIYRAAIAGAI